jgi:tRNA(Ile)-lysidine synthase TilS/MesJ
MNYCKQCLLKEGTFNATLNQNQICNYCKYYESHIKTNFNIEDAYKMFINRLNKMKGKYEYDALVGLSGGKDSTYVLHQLVDKYCLKVIAITYDNCFLTDFAHDNIKKFIDQFKVDHIFYVPDRQAHKSFYKATTLNIANPCTACATGGYFLALKICFERKIPFFIHGRTPYQMFSTMYEGTDDPFLHVMNTNLQEHSFKKISEVYKPMHQNVRNFIKSLFDNGQEAKEVLNEFFLEGSEFSEEFAPESLSFFLSHPYNEEKIKEQLSREIGWIKPDNDELLSHHDCDIHDAVFYLFSEINDADLLEPEISTMLRMGHISKEKAGKMLETARKKWDKPHESIKSLCNVCGIKEEDINKTIILKKNK